MSNVLFYSKYCDYCKKLLYEIGKSEVQNNIHFLSIDKRTMRNNKIYIILDNGKEIYLPPNIKKVPSLLLLNKNNRILVGEDVFNFLRPQINQEKEVATQNNMEPLAYSTYEMGTTLSDNYSYLDMTAEELSAKGNGGLRQMHSYCTIHQNQTIATPPDDYEPDKVGAVDLGKLQMKRAADIRQKR